MPPPGLSILIICAALTTKLISSEWSPYGSLAVKLLRHAAVKISLAFTFFPLMTYAILYHTPVFPWFFGSTSHSIIQRVAYLLLSLLAPATVSYCVLYSIESQISQEYDRYAWDSERQRGLIAGEDEDRNGYISCDERIKESAEWLNSTLKCIWPIVNMDLCVTWRVL